MPHPLPEAPRGGAGIEISVDVADECISVKPLVEGLVLKSRRGKAKKRQEEAPRGGAGIEIGRPDTSQLSPPKPLVEGLVLK